MNEQDWYYKKIEVAGGGKTFVESRPILENNLNTIYTTEIIADRPRDRTKKYELQKDESYVINPSIKTVRVGLGIKYFDVCT